MSTLIEAPPPKSLFEPPDDILYEVVSGVIKELPPIGAQELGIANLLARYLWFFLGPTPNGHVVVEMLFRLEATRPLERRPDVAYVSFQRWPQRIIPATNAWEVAPELAVEVVSPTNSATEVQEKVEEYFQHGVELVWVIYPIPKLVHVYENSRAIRVLQSGDTLEGGTVFPGLQLPVENLFEFVTPSI